MMCGTNAHGKVSDALRNGGCAHIFDWNTLAALNDGYGFTDVGGYWRVLKQVMAQPDQRI